MAKKDQEKRSRKKENDKDFGLPEIEITPISKEESTPDPAPVVVPPVIMPAKNAEANDLTPPAEAASAYGLAKDQEEKDEKERSNAWWIILLILLLLLGGFGTYYYINYYGAPDKKASPEVTQQPQVEAPAPEQPEVVTPPETEKPQAPVLTEMSEKGEKPHYLVTVGAFIDGDLARDFSARLNKKGYSTYLVLPGYGSSFYKLAIADFDNVVDATAMIKEEQPNFEETLWVFKY